MGSDRNWGLSGVRGGRLDGRLSGEKDGDASKPRLLLSAIFRAPCLGRRKIASCYAYAKQGLKSVKWCSQGVSPSPTSKN